MIERHLVVALLFGSALALAGCDDPVKDAPKATVSSAAPATSAAPVAAKTAGPDTSPAPPPAAIPPAPADALTVAPGSTLEFVGAKLTGTHDGKFERVSGWGALGAGDKPEGGKVAALIDMNSLSTPIDKLTAHLKSADLFDVARHPQAAFVSTDIRAGGDKGATHTVTGDLELHGVKKTISFPATIKVSKDDVKATAEFSINRKQWNLVYPGMPDDLIKDDVLIKLSLNLTRKAK